MISSLYQKHDVQDGVLEKWQCLVDLMAKLLQVPAGLIMRVGEEHIEVLVSSKSPGNPYQPDEKADLGSGLYCETVMKTRTQLAVPNALQSEKWKQNPDVELNMISYLGIPLIWPDGSVFGTICVLDDKTRHFSSIEQSMLLELKQIIEKDFSERKETEETNKLLTLAIEQAAESIVITDKEETIQYVNPAFEKLTGYLKEEVIGKNTDFLKSGQQGDAFYKDISDTLSSGQTWHGEMSNKSKSGFIFTEDVTISPVFNSKGEITNYIGVKRDVTNQRALEAELAQAQKMETVGRLAGGVAHDFNNMLSVILGYSDIVLNKIDLQDPIRKSVQEIKKAAERSADITHQLLAFSRKQIIEPKKILLNPRIKEMEKMLGRLIGEDIKLQFNPADGLWAISADQGQLNQIVANLVVNARDAMPKGGNLTIETNNINLDEVYCQKHLELIPGNYVLLTVCDNGSGIDNETLTHIFEPFYTTKELGQGTGLGLSTVYGIMKQYKGFISVTSELHVGTTFKLYFPQSEENEEENLVESSVKESTSLPQISILLVEDDEMVRELTKEILEELGHTVIATESSKDALSFCKNNELGNYLLLTDVIMPEMSGPELKQAINLITPNVKTLFMSGYTNDAISHQGVLDEGAYFIQKPFTMDELARKVIEAIEQ